MRDEKMPCSPLPPAVPGGAGTSLVDDSPGPPSSSSSGKMKGDHVTTLSPPVDPLPLPMQLPVSLRVVGNRKHRKQHRVYVDGLGSPGSPYEEVQLIFEFDSSPPVSPTRANWDEASVWSPALSLQKGDVVRIEQAEDLGCRSKNPNRRDLLVTSWVVEERWAETLRGPEVVLEGTGGLEGFLDERKSVEVELGRRERGKEVVSTTSGAGNEDADDDVLVDDVDGAGESPRGAAGAAADDRQQHPTGKLLPTGKNNVSKYPMFHPPLAMLNGGKNSEDPIVAIVQCLLQRADRLQELLGDGAELAAELGKDRLILVRKSNTKLQELLVWTGGGDDAGGAFCSEQDELEHQEKGGGRVFNLPDYLHSVVRRIYFVTEGPVVSWREAVDLSLSESIVTMKDKNHSGEEECLSVWHAYPRLLADRMKRSLAENGVSVGASAPSSPVHWEEVDTKKNKATDTKTTGNSQGTKPLTPEPEKLLLQHNCIVLADGFFFVGRGVPHPRGGLQEKQRMHLPSGAYYKIAEAGAIGLLGSLGETETSSIADVVHTAGFAVDVGAAPGGWSHFLASDYHQRSSLRAVISCDLGTMEESFRFPERKNYEVVPVGSCFEDLKRRIASLPPHDPQHVDPQYEKPKNGRVSGGPAAAATTPVGEPGGTPLSTKDSAASEALSFVDSGVRVDAPPVLVLTQHCGLSLLEKLGETYEECVSLLCSDMNIAVLELEVLVRSGLRALRKDAVVLLTMKKCLKSTFEKDIEALGDIMKGLGFREIKVHQLFANTKMETTLVGVWGGGGPKEEIGRKG